MDDFFDIEHQISFISENTSQHILIFLTFDIRADQMNENPFK